MQGFGHRITRQQVLADFADSALRLDDLDRILVEACRIAGDILGTGQVKLLELQDGGTLFRVRAGVGPCTVGQAWGPVDDQSPEARAVATGQPVLVPDTGTESHAAVVQGGNAAALASVPILRPGGRAYGVLQAYGPAPPAFAAEDVQALRACAAILGLAVERLLKPGDGQVEDDQFRLAAETALDHAIILTDAEDRVTAWFPGAAAVFGWTRDEMLGQPVSVLSTLGDREAWQDAAEPEAAEAHESAPTGRWRLRKDGVRVFIDGTVRVLRDKGGAVRGFLRIGQDATAKHGADEALRASEDRFRGFAENSADTLWIANDTGETLDYLSPAFERMFGAERGPIMADTSRLIDLVHPEDRPRFLAAMPRAAAG